MGNKPKYRGFVYTEFNPLDFEQHFYAQQLNPLPSETPPFEKWEDFMVSYTEKNIEALLGPGKIVNAIIAPVEGSAAHYYCKGYYYFDSMDFTEEQKENQKKIGIGPYCDGAWYELVPETEAAIDAQ